MTNRPPGVRALCSLLVLAATIAVPLSLLLRATSAEAERIIVRDGDLYSVSGAFGEKRLTTNANIKILYGHKNGKILFSKGWKGIIPDSEAGGTTQLFLMNEDGTGIRQISNKPVIGGFFDVHGKQVFYTTENFDLYLTGLDGKTHAKVQEKVSGPRQSPGGKFLVYKKMRPDWTPGQFGDSALGLTVLNTETGEEKRLTDRWEDFAAFWTPDGMKIVFYSTNSLGLVSQFVMNADGTEKKQLTNIDQEFVTDKTVATPSQYPVWSPSGDAILYESDRQIWINVYNDDYTEVIDARPIAYGRDPQWNEDGKTLTVVVTSGLKSKETSIAVDRNGTLVK